MKWTPCFTSLASPTLNLPRFGHTAVVVNGEDKFSDLVVVYGGVGAQTSGDNAQIALGDVVVLQVDSGTWSAPDILADSSSSTSDTHKGHDSSSGGGGSSTPGPRAFHSAVAVPGQQVLVFGGHILTLDQEHSRKRRTFYNDVWLLDTVDWQWRLLPINQSAAGSPPRRDMAALLLLDDQKRLLLFGGRSENGKALQDTWTFDLGKCVWQQLRPEGPPPPPRKMHSMVQLGSQVVVFGGERDSGPLDDLWVLRGVAGRTSSSSSETLRWTQVKIRAGPSPRFGHTMVTWPAAAGRSAGGTACSFNLNRGLAATGSTEADGSSDSENERSSSSSSSSSRSSLPGEGEQAAAAAAGTLTSEEESLARHAAGGGAAAAGGGGGGGGGASGPVLPRASSTGSATKMGPGSSEAALLFGGCLDLSSFLSLNRNYVQSKETWLLDMKQLSWTQLSQATRDGEAAGASSASNTAAAAAGGGGGGGMPSERMCHSLSRLPDGRLLLLGGRHKDGICQDQWWFSQQADDGQLPPSPALSMTSSLSSRSSATTTGRLGAAHSSAGAGVAAARPGGSLLQSLLAPMRSREATQQAPAPALTGAASAGSIMDDTSLPKQQQQQQQHDHMVAQQSSATAHQDQQQQQQWQWQWQSQPSALVEPVPPSPSLPPAPPPGVPAAAPDPPMAAAAAAAATAPRPGSSSVSYRMQNLAGIGALAGSGTVASGSSSSSGGSSTNIGSSLSGQPLASFMDVGSEQLKQLIRNPAAYSADALNKLSNSVTSTMTSLLGSEGQAGAIPRSIPAAIHKVAPGLLGPGSSSSLFATLSTGKAPQPPQPPPPPPAAMHPGIAAIRAQLGLPASVTTPTETAAAAAAELGRFGAPGEVLQALVVLGQRLLGDAGGSSNSSSSIGSSGWVADGGIPADVLVAAARQHLMSSTVTELKLPQVALLLADYQQLAPSFYERQVLSRLGDGFHAAAAAGTVDGGGCFFLHRQPHELLYCQVELLQSEYKHLLMSEAN